MSKGFEFELEGMLPVSYWIIASVVDPDAALTLPLLTSDSTHLFITGRVHEANKPAEALLDSWEFFTC